MKSRDIAFATAIAIGTATAASAAPVHAHFDFIGNQGLQGVGESLEFTSGGLSLSATGHIMNEDGSIGEVRQIGQYGTETVFNRSTWTWQTAGGGLGVTTSAHDSHQVDSRNNDEVIKLSFNKEVTLKRVYFSLVDWDDDFSFSMIDGDNAGAFYQNIDIAGQGYGYFDFDQEWSGFVFGIGAADSTCHAWGFSYSCDNKDNFKVTGVKVSYDEIAPVPLPAAGWLLIAAIGGLGVMRRRT